MILRFLTAIQLTRLTLAFGAVSDLWFAIILTRAMGPFDLQTVTLPLGWVLAAGAFVAIGLFAFGEALNDVLDARHDSAFRPDRPIPAGRIMPVQAIVIVAASLMLAIVGAMILGELAVIFTLIAAAGILFYNAAGKFVPGAGIVTLGLIHAVHMLIPNVNPPIVLPTALVMTHAMAIAGVVYWYEGKRPRISVAGAGTGGAGLALLADDAVGLRSKAADALAGVCGFVADRFSSGRRAWICHDRAVEGFQSER